MVFQNRILILFAHPVPQKSKVNRQLSAAVRDLPGVTFHDLYEAYPDLEIDVELEQRLLREHNVVVLQHPFYWYSTPAILKEWCDLVLEYGFAYGEGGTSLEGKAWIHALTAGGSKSAYGPQGHNRFSIRECLTPMDQTAYLCGMTFLPPFAVHETLRLDPRTEIPQIASQYKDLIQVLRGFRVPWRQIPKWESMNEHLEELRLMGGG